MTGDPRVKELYEENLKKGMTPKEAAKDAQARTGLAARTGLPFKRTRRTLKQIDKVGGQFD